MAGEMVSYERVSARGGASVVVARVVGTDGGSAVVDFVTIVSDDATVDLDSSIDSVVCVSGRVVVDVLVAGVGVGVGVVSVGEEALVAAVVEVPVVVEAVEVDEGGVLVITSDSAYGVVIAEEIS